MLFYRKILKEIDNWHESLKIKKRALVIKGLRQIGKTTTALNYAKSKYSNVIYINFMDNDNYKKVFDKDLIVDNIIRDLSALNTKYKFIPNDTVIIFDELQECSNARTAIKVFMLDGRFDIIATGSLLGLRGYNKKNNKGIPTGFEYIIQMYPMDFEEYLIAREINFEIFDYLKKCYINKEKISDAINLSMHDYFREYLCVGGMPDAVITFLKTHDLNQVRIVLKNILEEYKDDFGKHLDEKENKLLDKAELTKIMNVYNSIPNQLAKENKKFKYNEINRNAKSREYRSAITWLEEFGLITICYNIKSFQIPIEANIIEKDFKIYVSDSGLYNAMLDNNIYSNILNGNLLIYKGAIYENIIANTFLKLGNRLFYYRNDNGMEIDFVTDKNNEVELIEVKSTNGNAKSLKQIINNKEKYGKIKAIKLTDGNIGYKDEIYTIPLYLAYLI